MFKKIIVIFVFTALLAGCSGKNTNRLGRLEVIKKVEFEEPLTPMSTVKSGNNYIAFDAVQRRIVIFNKNGQILYSYEKHGKGPGEYLREEDLFLLGIYENKLYVLEYARNRVLIFNIENNSKLEYYDEFSINDGQIITGGISPDGKLYLNEMIGEKLFRKYDRDGNFINGLIDKEKTNLDRLSAEEIKQHYVDNIFIPHFSENGFVLTGIFNKHIKFYKKSGEDTELLEDTIIKQYQEKGYNSKTQQSKNQREVYLENIGIAGSGILKGSYYMGLAPSNEKNSLLNKYNLKGDYIGSYLIESDINMKIENLFLFDNDEIIFTKTKRENRDDSFKRETDYFFIAKLVENN
ncbi:MAG: hypothetical protein FXF47_02955 [Candidatus Mcinerneyibacterium aminivorans]|uniref:6-bladed beta-propeller n=1 Tax=Candidatus Mcinerneyibacterium aminivorans TaxID=2703815 RepID=A0A5D0MLW2_9BACT|nr:MAG: hypothetical protein FXF47_02955 [Candidatus Mcinerneyibacterium aminivorans]